MQDIKFAVVAATYCRKNNKSAGYLRRMFENLENQTYSNFKLFLIGDDYSKRAEFEALCKTFPQDKIFYSNLVGSYRIKTFKINANKWTCGGAPAKYQGIKQAMKEGFKYYLHLDDDDIWFPNHIQEHYNTIKKFPEVDFIYSLARYCNKKTLPAKYDPDIALEYNNRLPNPSGVVHSTWCINLETIGPKLIKFFEQRMKLVQDFKNRKIIERPLPPMDLCTINMIRTHVNSGNWKCIFNPVLTVSKESDCNIPR